MRLLAIDPGTTESGWVILDGGKPVDAGVMENSKLRDRIRCGWWTGDSLAIEMIASYGMAVGAEVFRTVWWTGRLADAWFEVSGHLPIEVYRREVKEHLCHNPKAKDTNIRQALIDRFGPGKDVAIGNKKSPGPLYSVKSHAWPALAVAVTVMDKAAA